MGRTLIFLLLPALLLSGCGRSTPSAPAATKSVRLQVSGDPAELEGYRALVAAYESAHPGKKITLLPVGKQKDHMAKLATSFAAGDPPELFMLNFRRFGQFAERGVLEPLGPALTAAGHFKADDYYAPALEAFQLGGQQQCLPQNVSSLVVYYNRALFKAAGIDPPGPDWTLLQFQDKAIKLTRDTDNDGKADIYGVGIEPSLIRLAPFVWGIGAELVNDLQNPSHMALDRPVAMRALAWFKQLNSRFGVVPPLAAHQAEDEESRFARGGLAMLFESRKFTATLRGIKGLDWDVAPFPRLAKPGSVLHSDAYCMAKSTKDKPAALDFVAFALGEQGQALLSRTGRLVPSLKSVAQSPAFLDPTQPPASAQVFLDQIPLLRRTPNVAVWHEVESKADAIIEEWFYEPKVGGAAVESEEGAGEGRELVAQLRDAINPILLKGAQERAAAAAPASK